jgi:hypothetical protein
MPVDAVQGSQRRNLHFDSIDQIMADVDQLADAQKQGKLRSLGNWTAGQNLGHLASWIDYSYDGVPFKVPFIARIVMRPFKKAFLYKPMKPGSRIPKLPGGTAGIDVIPFDDGLARFRKNLARLKSGPPKIPHALFGPFTHDEWIAQHLRHAELHLSFLRAD